MLTEDEAKTKFCPMMLAVRGDGVSGFNMGTNCQPDVACLCVGSACMMWRGQESRSFKAARAEAAYRHPGNGDREGYCGLAGQPS